VRQEVAKARRRAERHLPIRCLAPVGEHGVKRIPDRLDGVAERLEQPPDQGIASPNRENRDADFEWERRIRQFLAILRPFIAVPNWSAMATDRNDDATYGRSLTYGSSEGPGRRPRTKPTGSMSSRSVAVHRSGVATG
jgi:hypothetical protein